MVTAPGTATVAAKAVPGKTLVISASGLGPQATAKVRVTGPKKYARTLRVDGKVRLTGLRPGRYKVVAKRVGKARAIDRLERVRVKKSRGAKVRFTYYATPTPKPSPDTTPPEPVRDLRVTDRTSTTIELAWKNPPPSDFLEVQVIRSGGTDRDPLDFEISNSGDSLRDTGLTPGATYRYTLTTIDDAGNTSEKRTITVTTLVS